MTRECAIECVQSFIDTFEICKENHEPIETSINGEDVIAFKMAIEALEQEPKTGHWIKTKEQDDAEPLILWKCSECLTVQRLKTNYCPNCGLKMEVIKMTLNEAIQHAERIAKIEEQACFLISNEDGDYDNHKKCGEHYRQLAGWLKDYKAKEEINQSLLYENERLIGSVQEIKAEINDVIKEWGEEYSEGLFRALEIIDKHMSWEGEE